ncbi:hypothetical protein M885DRAFT_523014 [Pelagophyceae sp. CCMP2097]|nr:hypothetical protein M885DRAFT_523014 [Pelagophyceae sp. CCMP2097]
MVDTMGTPYHHPLLDGVHVVYFDNRNESDLILKVKHALNHPRWARAVAVRGYAHVLKHHRAVSWVDYFLRTAHSRLVARGTAAPPQAYMETGDDVLDRSLEDVSHGRDQGAAVLSSSDLESDDAGGAHGLFSYRGLGENAPGKKNF